MATAVLDTPCDEWAGARNNRGYGVVSIGGRLKLTHRVAYEKAKGAIPEGLEIDHLCRNPACRNPDHLEAVTHQENVWRGTSGQFGGRSSGNTRRDPNRCRSGRHDLRVVGTHRVGRRTRKNGDPYTTCAGCHNEANQRYSEKKRVR